MLKALAGISILALLALPVIAQVRHHRAHPSTQTEGATVPTQAARDAANAADAAANEAAAGANAAAAAAAGDDNVATDATAYDANADMSMDTNMTMDENVAANDVVDMGSPAPTHRRRARPRHR